MHTTYTKKKQQFELAYANEVDNIFGFLYVRLGDRERALELTQDTFMRTWQYLSQGKEIEAMRPFLFTTAYNLFKNELRAKKETVSLDMMMEHAGFEPGSLEHDQEKKLEWKMLITKVGSLPEQYEEVLKMRYVEGLEVKRIAQKLNESATTVSVRIHRGIEKLRNAYYEKFITNN